MPLYQYRCPAGHELTAYRSIDKRHDISMCECCRPLALVICPSFVIDDMQPYRSPLDGSIINSRSAHEKHKRDHDVIEVGNERPSPRKPYEPTGIVEDIKRAMGDG